ICQCLFTSGLRHLVDGLELAEKGRNGGGQPEEGSDTSGQYTGDGSVDFHGRVVLKGETGNWKACLFILGCECCERLAFFGIDTNLVNYLTGKLHQGNVSAARIVTTWSGTCSLTPLLGAFLADAYWGRYWTIVVSSVVYIIVILISPFSFFLSRLFFILGH
ncbi:hypothetical protein KSS87_002734, partial [Heliosperma pusillum]